MEALKPPPTTVSRILLTADQSNGRFSIVDETFQPGMKSFPHKHTFHSEVFLIIDGQMRWTVGGRTETIGPGDLVFIPPDTVRQAEVIGDRPAHVIVIYEPAGYERNMRRRVQTPGEKMKDPEFRGQMMQQADVVPAR